MTNQERAAMQQALNVLAEASGLVSEYKGCHSRLIEAIKELREALANTRSSIRSNVRSTSEYSEQAEQEPDYIPYTDEELKDAIKLLDKADNVGTTVS